MTKLLDFPFLLLVVEYAELKNISAWKTVVALEVFFDRGEELCDFACF